MAGWGLVAAHGVTTHGYDDFEPQRACVTARSKRGQSACGVYLLDLETAATAGRTARDGEAKAWRENVVLSAPPSKRLASSS
jgi:hypothetical protein